MSAQSHRFPLLLLCLTLIPGLLPAQKKPQDFIAKYNEEHKPDILVGVTGSMAPLEKGLMPLLGGTAIVNFFNYPAFGLGVSVKGWAINKYSPTDNPYIESSFNKTGPLLGGSEPLNYELVDDKRLYQGTTVCGIVSLQVPKTRLYLSPGVILTNLSQYVLVNPKLMDGHVYFPDQPSLDPILVRAEKQTRALNESNLGFSLGCYYDINPVAISAGVDFYPTGIKAVSIGLLYGIPRIF